MSTGFTALGEMAMSLAKVGAHSVMGPLLPRVADQIKEAISVKGRARPNCPEALQCVGVLAQALGSTWKTEATSLVQPMMSTGLSQPLVKTLQVICQFISSVLILEVRYLCLQTCYCGQLQLVLSTQTSLGSLSSAYRRFAAACVHVLFVWVLGPPELTVLTGLHCSATATNHNPHLHLLGFCMHCFTGAANLSVPHAVLCGVQPHRYCQIGKTLSRRQCPK